MSLGKFLLYTAIGSTTWNALLIGAGWTLGSEWERVEDYTSIMEYAVIIIVAVIGIGYIWRRKNRLVTR